jgi:hypothetical protein
MSHHRRRPLEVCRKERTFTDSALTWASLCSATRLVRLARHRLPVVDAVDRCRIVGQRNTGVDPDIEDFDERMPHGPFVPGAEVKCLEYRTKPIGDCRQHAPTPYAYHRLRQGCLRRLRQGRGSIVSGWPPSSNHVSSCPQRLRYVEVERVRGTTIDEQLEGSRLVKRYVSDWLPAENADHVVGGRRILFH